MTTRLDGQPAVLYSPVCLRCRRLRDGDRTARACAAFPAPGSIPLAIWNGADAHTAPVAGDRGLQFAAGTPPLMKTQEDRDA